MISIRLALDWTPNINHLGFFVAREKGWYRARGLRVELLDPAADNYQVTPAKKVELGQADFALCPLESIISYRTKPQPFALQAVAAILQEDLSAIAVRADAGIESPRDLDGRTYASYGARYEDGIVRQMVRNAGGRGELVIEYPDKLGIWETLIQDRCAATWVFLNWEGVEAQQGQVPLRYFKMRDYAIPYSYSPVIAAAEGQISNKRDPYRAFLAATWEGYRYAAQEPAAALELLAPFLPPRDRQIDLQQCLAQSLAAFGTDHNWGRMAEGEVAVFLDWIHVQGLEALRLSPAEVMTNELLPSS
ncbi:MAG: ABC transporter substrate-binding protein [Bacteroidota bacterium]